MQQKQEKNSNRHIRKRVTKEHTATSGHDTEHDTRSPESMEKFSTQTAAKHFIPVCHYYMDAPIEPVPSRHKVNEARANKRLINNSGEYIAGKKRYRDERTVGTVFLNGERLTPQHHEHYRIAAAKKAYAAANIEYVMN